MVEDLAARFDAILNALEATEGWITARVKRPVMILGSLDGVETGVRNLIRSRPLEVEEHVAPRGHSLLTMVTTMVTLAPCK